MLGDPVALIQAEAGECLGGEYALLAEAFTDLFEFLHLKEYLPEDTVELSFYAEQIPLQASSPCYHFGGFVINLNAFNWAHRDKNDKRMCLLLPLGRFTGGDILVFPSCDLNRFN
ncbi:hypothetical protein B0H14DRAFT_3427473 [Mycena olivaceomarginata]|nr:hypothetical protein B0H14DRAFT_3427473 [Mycena olivaceomarginata]